MPDRDAQTVILSRPTILLVTGVGVGLLTLTYVLGVQVGKQSAALHQVRARTAGEELVELPASIDEQLKLLDNREFEKTRKSDASSEPPEPKEDAAPKAEPKKPEVNAKSEAKAETKGEEKWTLQLVATPDETEAKRVAEKTKASGFTPTIVKGKGQFKVRLAKTGSRAEMEAASAKLKARGQASFPVKAE